MEEGSGMRRVDQASGAPGESLNLGLKVRAVVELLRPSTLCAGVWLTHRGPEHPVPLPGASLPQTYSA